MKNRVTLQRGIIAGFFIIMTFMTVLMAPSAPSKKGSSPIASLNSFNKSSDSHSAHNDSQVIIEVINASKYLYSQEAYTKYLVATYSYIPLSPRSTNDLINTSEIYYKPGYYGDALKLAQRLSIARNEVKLITPNYESYYAGEEELLIFIGNDLGSRASSLATS